MAQKKRKRGAPRIFDNAARRKRFFRLLLEHGLRGKACRAADINYQTFLNEINRSPEFAAEVEATEEQALDDLESVVIRGSRKDPALAFRVLQARRPAKWREQKLISHEGAVSFQVVEDPGWFGNNAHDVSSTANNSPAEGSPSSTASDTLSGANEAPGLRETLGEDGSGFDV